MTPAAVSEAAALLWHHGSARSRLDGLPAGCRPTDRTEGDAVQASLAEGTGAAALGDPRLADYGPIGSLALALAFG